MAMAATTTLPQRIGALPVVRRLKRSSDKRVKWASADQLCQIRMFLAEDAPFLAGVAQEQLQVKSSSFMHMISDLPPGFGGAFGRVGAPPSKMINNNFAAPSAMKSDIEALVASVAPAIAWKCPQKIELDVSWHVEAGEDSHEVGAQKQRESTTLEALYPRSSAIPNSPVEPLDQGVLVDDRSIPAIPVTAPDEDSDGEETPAPVGPNGAKPVIGLNAAAVSNNVSGYFGPASSGGNMLRQISSEKELSSSSSGSGGIDTNLLLQLLANPSLVATLSGLQQQNQSMVNSPNGNHLVVTPPNQAVIGCSSQSAANLTSLTTTVTTTTPIVASPSSSSSWPEAHQQYQQQQFHQKPVLHQAQTRGQQQMPGVPPGFQQQFMMQQQQQGRGRDDEKYFKELIMQHGGAGGGGGGSFGQPGTVHPQQHQQHQQHQQQQQQQGGRGSGPSYHHQQQNHHKQHKQGNGYVSNGQHHPPGFGLSGEKNSSSAANGGGGAPRGRRVCAYYNTAKGCRNGLKCPFIHDANKRGGEVLHQQQQHKRMRGGFMQPAAAAAAAAAGSDGERF